MFSMVSEKVFFPSAFSQMVSVTPWKVLPHPRVEDDSFSL